MPQGVTMLAPRSKARGLSNHFLRLGLLMCVSNKCLCKGFPWDCVLLSQSKALTVITRHCLSVPLTLQLAFMNRGDFNPNLLPHAIRFRPWLDT